MSAKSTPASTVSGSPRSSPSSHSPPMVVPATVTSPGCGVSSCDGDAGGASITSWESEAGDPHATSNPHITPTVASRHRLTWRRRAGPRLCCRMTRIPCGQGVLRPEGCRWSVLGLSYVQHVRRAARPARWCVGRARVDQSGVPDCRREAGVAAPDLASDQPCRGRTAPGARCLRRHRRGDWRPVHRHVVGDQDPGQPRDRTPARSVGCLSRVEVDADRRCSARTAM